MSYRLKAVTIRTNNSEEGIRKIAELWEDVLTGKLPLLSDGIVPISQYSNYESDEKGDYDISIVGVEHNFFEDIEKEVEKGLYKKYEAIDEIGSVELCTKKAWENVWNDTHSGVLKRAFTVDFESSVPKEFSKDGKAHCYLYIAIESIWFKISCEIKEIKNGVIIYDKKAEIYKILEKFNIPYEYDEIENAFVIYGYKN